MLRTYDVIEILKIKVDEPIDNIREKGNVV